jgi:hypothetical protein
MVNQLPIINRTFEVFSLKYEIATSSIHVPIGSPRNDVVSAIIFTHLLLTHEIATQCLLSSMIIAWRIPCDN